MAFLGDFFVLPVLLAFSQEVIVTRKRPATISHCWQIKNAGTMQQTLLAWISVVSNFSKSITESWVKIDCHLTQQ